MGFTQSDDTCLFITYSMVTAHLWHTAYTVFNTDKNDPELFKWSIHSIGIMINNFLLARFKMEVHILSQVSSKHNLLTLSTSAHISGSNLTSSAIRQWCQLNPHKTIVQTHISASLLPSISASALPFFFFLDLLFA